METKDVRVKLRQILASPLTVTYRQLQARVVPFGGLEFAHAEEMVARRLEAWPAEYPLPIPVRNRCERTIHG